MSQGLASGEAVQPSSLGEGVVIRTVPRTRRRLPVLLGYADRRGQWYSNGRLHQPPAQLDVAPVSGGPEL